MILKMQWKAYHDLELTSNNMLFGKQVTPFSGLPSDGKYEVRKKKKQEGSLKTVIKGKNNM